MVWAELSSSYTAWVYEGSTTGLLVVLLMDGVSDLMTSFTSSVVMNGHAGKILACPQEGRPAKKGG